MRLIAVFVCIVKAVRVIVDIVIIVFFAKFILFFLNLRALELRRLTLFNKLILSIVLLLFALCIYQTLFTFAISVIYIDPNLNTLESQYFQLVSTNIFNLKDFLVGLMLSYLFYFKSMQ